MYSNKTRLLLVSDDHCGMVSESRVRRASVIFGVLSVTVGNRDTKLSQTKISVMVIDPGQGSESQTTRPGIIGGPGDGAVSLLLRISHHDGMTSRPDATVHGNRRTDPGRAPGLRLSPGGSPGRPGPNLLR